MRKTPSLQPPASSLRHGSIMILVVVVIVLMAVMGMAYVQLARVDRMATSQPKASNIDNVVSAVVGQIQLVLKDDLVNTRGHILEEGLSGIGSPTQFAKMTNFDEAYDYPWTNPDATIPENRFQVELQYAASAWARGSYLDDMWLASSAPVPVGMPGGPIQWPHITNLNGLFLDIPAAGGAFATLGDTGANGEHVVTNAGNINVSDTDIAVADLLAPRTNDFLPRGADADGDGIPDSRWTWAPIREIGGVNYVMAVRIIDNSSMLNVNTATALTTDGNVAYGTVAANKAPVGLWPTSADMTRLLRRLPQGQNVALAMRKLFEYRLPGIPLTQLIPTRTDFNVATSVPTVMGSQPWQQQEVVSLYGYPLLPAMSATQERYRFGWAEELNLRFGNGVRSKRFGETALETALAGAPTMGMAYDYLRCRNPNDPAEPKNEGKFSDVDSSWDLGSEPDMLRSFVGNPTTGELRDIRKWLTTYSGAAVLAPYDPTMPAPLPPMTAKIDLNPKRVAGWTAAERDATLNELYRRVYRIFQMGNPTAGTTSYLGLNAGQLRDLAAQFAANVGDYMDSGLSSYGPTKITVGTTNYYGLEPMPFLREVYVQQRYVATDQDTNGLADTWNADVSGGTGGLAVEVGNPFDAPIMVNPAGPPRFRIQVTVPGVATDNLEIQTGAFTGATLLTSILPGQTVVFYANPTSTGAPVDDIGSMINTTGSTRAYGANTSGLFGFNYLVTGGGAGVVRLQVNVDYPNGTQWVTYDEMEVPPLMDDGTQFTMVGMTEGAVPIGADGHSQAAEARPCPTAAGDGPYYVVAGVGGSAVPNYPAVLTRDVGNVTTSSGDTLLGVDNKGLTFPAALRPALDKFYLRVPDRPIYNPAELGWISLIGFHDGTNGTFTRQMNDFITAVANPTDTGTNTGNTNILRPCFLDFSSYATIPVATDPNPGRGIAHAAMVLDEISTLSPQHDGDDNDNDDLDYPANTFTAARATHEDGTNTNASGPYELFVPGTINVNTMPWQILRSVLPLPEDPAEVLALARFIDYYVRPPSTDPRTNRIPPTMTTASLRTTPGIESLGELMWLQAHQTGAGQLVTNAQRWASEPNPTPVDWMKVYPRVTAYPGTPPANDAMERMQRFQFLNQVLTTRSDVFTAYVEIRGYPADDWRKGPVEQTRFLAVFDRGRFVVDTGTAPDVVKVRLVGLYRY